MKKILALMSVLAMSASASATLELALRGDGVGTNSYADPLGVQQQGSSYLDVEYARLFFKAKLTDSLSSIIVVDFLQTGAANAAGTELFKVAELNQKFNDTFSFGIGRLQDPGIGGYEGLTPFYDLWMTSSSFYANYPMGADLDININPDQQVKLVVLNQNWDQGSTAGSVAYSTGNSSLNQTQGGAASTSQTTVGYGARWRSNWTSEYSTMLSYDVNPTYNAVTNSQSSTNSYLVASGQYKHKDLLAQLDFMDYNYGHLGTSNLDNATKYSFVGNVKYTLGNWVPRVKAEYSVLNDVPGVYFLPNGNAATANFWGETFANSIGATGYQDQIFRLDLGTDYRLNEAAPVYYSFHVVSSTNQFSGTSKMANNNINETAIYASLVGKFDVLK